MLLDKGLYGQADLQFRVREPILADAEPVCTAVRRSILESCWSWESIMTVIQKDNNLCTVVVTVDAEAEVMPELEAHAKSGLQRFSEFEGFVSGALHKSTDGLRLIQYLQWENEAAHLKCMNHPMWNDVPSTKRFMEIVESGRAKMVVRVVDIVTVAERRNPDV